MAAQLLQFPNAAMAAPLSRRSHETQAHAHRIVAQIEREIANQAYRQAQMRFSFVPLPVVVEMETPATVVKRILRTLFWLDRSA